MEECAAGYAAYVVELLETAKQTCSDPVIMIEQRVNFTRWVQDGFGTADCILIADGVMNIVDYKQLMFYQNPIQQLLCLTIQLPPKLLIHIIDFQGAFTTRKLENFRGRYQTVKDAETQVFTRSFGVFYIRTSKILVAKGLSVSKRISKKFLEIFLEMHTRLRSSF